MAKHNRIKRHTHEKTNTYVCSPDTMCVKILDASSRAVAVALYYNDKEIFKRSYKIGYIDDKEDAYTESVVMLCEELIGLHNLGAEYIDWFPNNDTTLVEYAGKSLKEVRKKSGLLVWKRK
tara:strand:+ start:517 stop:879 length:363 start_codon:yes stop_codon:yes gene_type:complete